MPRRELRQRLQRGIAAALDARERPIVFVDPEARPTPARHDSDAGHSTDPHASGHDAHGHDTHRHLNTGARWHESPLLIGPLVIERLTHYQIGQSVRADGPQTHLSKAGTPTMGGALILIVILITTLLWGDLGNRYVWVTLLVTLAFGLVGFADDRTTRVPTWTEGLPLLGNVQDLVELIRRTVEQAAPGSAVEAKISGEAFLTPPGPIYDIVTEAIRAETGIEPKLSTHGGTSDGRYLIALCPVVDFGLPNATMHKLDEAASIEDIQALSSIYRRVLQAILT